MELLFLCTSQIRCGGKASFHSGDLNSTPQSGYMYRAKIPFSSILQARRFGRFEVWMGRYKLFHPVP